MENGRKKIGEVWVDSGQIMIGDPCYLDKWEADDFNGFDESLAKAPTGEYSYDGACRATSYSDHMSGMLGEGLAAVVSSGYGDGSYPVIATFKDGRIRKVEVVFF